MTILQALHDQIVSFLIHPISAIICFCGNISEEKLALQYKSEIVGLPFIQFNMRSLISQIE
jgi:hypothetical protein